MARVAQLGTDAQHERAQQAHPRADSQLPKLGRCGRRDDCTVRGQGRRFAVLRVTQTLAARYVGLAASYHAGSRADELLGRDLSVLLATVLGTLDTCSGASLRRPSWTREDPLDRFVPLSGDAGGTGAPRWGSRPASGSLVREWALCARLRGHCRNGARRSDNAEILAPGWPHVASPDELHRDALRPAVPDVEPRQPWPGRGQRSGHGVRRQARARWSASMRRLQMRLESAASGAKVSAAW